MPMPTILTRQPMTARIASASREKPAPSLEQVRHVLQTVPHGTDIEKRNRALIAFALLTGARDDAIASMSLRHVDLAARMVMQDARTVRTKRRKTFATYFFPVGEDVEVIVADWIAHLRTARMFGPDDPLFPKTRVASIEGEGFAAVGLDRAHWANAQAIRSIFRDAFTAAGLPTSSRIPFARRWCGSAKLHAERRRTSRPGARTSAMKAC